MDSAAPAPSGSPVQLPYYLFLFRPRHEYPRPPFLPRPRRPQGVGVPMARTNLEALRPPPAGRRRPAPYLAWSRNPILDAQPTSGAPQGPPRRPAGAARRHGAPACPVRPLPPARCGAGRRQAARAAPHLPEEPPAAEEPPPPARLRARPGRAYLPRTACPLIRRSRSAPQERRVPGASGGLTPPRVTRPEARAHRRAAAPAAPLSTLFPLPLPSRAPPARHPRRAGRRQPREGFPIALAACAPPPRGAPP
jgi:hypothetical protein